MNESQSSRPHRGLQAIHRVPRQLRAALGVLCAVPWLALAAQDRTVAREAAFLDAPKGPVVATLSAGTVVRRQEGRAGHTRVIIEGFVEGALLGGKKGRYQVHVSASGGAPMRGSVEGAATMIARLKTGTGLAVVVRSGKWVKVRRGGWVANEAFTSTSATQPNAAPATVPAAATAAPQGSPPSAAPMAAPVPPTATAAADLAATAPALPLPDGALITTRPAEVRAAPDGGSTVATLAKDAPMVPLARERGWVRVRVEGWVREADVTAADTLARSPISAADLRAEPLATRGRIVRWEVEVVAFQIADPLRRDLTPDEPYLLARGPGRENALLYLAIPPSLVAQAKAVPALSQVLVTARVRTGRSDPTGVPVLDIVQLSRK